MDITTLLPDWMKSEDIMAIVAGVAAFVSFLMIWNALLVKDTLPDRIKKLDSRRKKLKDDLVHKKTQRSPLIAKETLMHRVVKKLKLMKGEGARQISAHLAQAGWRSKDALVTYLFARISLPLFLITFGVIYFIIQNPFEWPLGGGIAGVVGMGVVGYALPGILVKNQIGNTIILQH